MLNIDTLAIGQTICKSHNVLEEILHPATMDEVNGFVMRSRLHAPLPKPMDNEHHIASLLSEYRNVIGGHITDDHAMFIYMDPLNVARGQEAGFSEYCLLRRVFPEIAKHNDCFLYPNGRASLAMSIHKLTKINKPVKVIGICSGGSGDLTVQSPMIQNDAVLAGMFNAERDFAVRWVKLGYAKQASHLLPVLKGILLEYVEEVSLPIDTLSLDCNGDEMYLSAFAEAVGCLSPLINAKTRIELMDYKVGDLRSINPLVKSLNENRGIRLRVVLSEYGVISSYLES